MFEDIGKIGKRALKYIVLMLAFIYIASPIDFLPEGLLGIFGFLDDIILMLIAFLTLFIGDDKILEFLI